jgi:hypothetical protein
LFVFPSEVNILMAFWAGCDHILRKVCRLAAGALSAAVRVAGIAVHQREDGQLSRSVA